MTDEDKKIGTMIRTRDPVTLEMEYAIGLKEEEARRLKSLLEAKNFEAMQEGQGAQPWSRLIAKLDWVINAADSDRASREAKVQDEPKSDEVP